MTPESPGQRIVRECRHLSLSFGPPRGACAACIDAHLAALTREVERRPELQRRAGLVWDGEQFVTPPAPEEG